MSVAPGALVVQRVGHRFGPARVLAAVSLTLRAGEVVAMVGPSGCGKTTLLRLCAGLMDPAEGRIDNGFTRPAVMFQHPRLLPWLTAAANIALGLKAQGLPRRQRLAAAHALGLRLGLTQDDLAKFPHALSGGMQSRVALARALAIDPDLLLLDEPFSALDVGLKFELHALLAQHVAERRTGVLMITHDLMEAVRLADRVLMMGAGPGRILRAFELAQPRPRRDERWVYETTAQLMQAREVRFGFGLPPARCPMNAVAPCKPPSM